MIPATTLTLGAAPLGGGRTQFRVWAPLAKKVEVHLVAPQDKRLPLQKDERGYHQAILEGVDPGAHYFYRLHFDRLTQTQEYPDPCSRYQPEGVRGPSQVVEAAFPWKDRSWGGLALNQYVLYELHVGTFTPEGTFEAIIPHLDRLKDLGVTALELMPLAQFSGTRNWGYDGVFPFAAQNSYGGPVGLKKLIDAAHMRQMAVVLDVVYNHSGPEGNVLNSFGSYTSSKYQTPWGPLFDFEGPDRAQVRRFFLENALYWITEFHVDALRLDAIHSILDLPKHSFLEKLSQSVRGQAQRLGRQVYLIAESDINDVRLIQSRQEQGYGLDAQWNDDFQRALHALLTDERFGYYQDFGKLSQLEKAIKEGFVISGQYSAYRKRAHGSSSRELPAHQFVVFDQNHDVVGNRFKGDRLNQLISLEQEKLSLGTVLLSPYVPMLFMGEEYGETAPFYYFTDHQDPQLMERVRRGRRKEFERFGWNQEPPDPQDEKTFLACKLDSNLWKTGRHRFIFDWTRELLALRKRIPALSELSKERMHVFSSEEKFLFIRRWTEGSDTLLILCFGQGQRPTGFPLDEGRWEKVLDSADQRWGGPGVVVPDLIQADQTQSIPFQPQALVLFVREDSRLSR